MSNASVGNIYHQIINEVIEASRVDFEDQGVGEEVLEELRKVCSFFPRSYLFLTLHTSHTNTRAQTIGLPLPSGFIPLEHHAFRASKSVSGLCSVCCAGPASLPYKALLAGPSWLPGLFVRSGAAGSGRWRGLRVRERRRAGGWESGLTGG